MGWLDVELVLVALAAMLSPTTLTFSVLALVLGDRPLRTGFLFYAGALGATLAVGVVAAFVIGDVAASHKSTPRTSVAIIDVIFGVVLLVYAVRLFRRPADPVKEARMVKQMSRVASSPAIAIVGAGAALANPGLFIPIALKSISETDPSTLEYIVDWVFFALVSVLPLGAAIVLLIVAGDWTERVLNAGRNWLQRRVWMIAAVILVVLGLTLLRNGIAGLAD